MTSQSSKPARRRDWLVVATLLALFAGLCVSSMSGKTATFDEVPHLAAGYSYLVRGDFRMNPEHPPLLKEWAALPLLAHGMSFSPQWPEWQLGAQWQFGQRLLFIENDAASVIFLARLPVVLIGCLLGLLVWCWSRDIAGVAAAHATLLIFAFTPDFLAHSQLVTTDVAVTTAVFFATYMAWRALRCWSWRRVLAMSAGFGAAMAIKFSSIVFAPVLFAYFAARSLAPRPWPCRTGPARTPHMLESRQQKLVVALKSLAALTLLSLFAIWACYGFHYAQPRTDGDQEFYSWTSAKNARSFLVPILEAARQLHVLPEPYVFGFLYTLRAAQKRLTFLNGAYSDSGWWYYFPTTFVLKTPLPLIAAIAAGLLALRRRLVRRSWRHLAIAVPVIVYLAVTFSANLNIGHRHLLPLYPFLLVLAADAIGQLLQKRLARYLVAAAAVWLVYGTWAVHPHYLAYFNEIAGGPQNGWRHLVDSNLDWGQDLPLLKQWMDQAGVKKLHLSYFGTALPEYYDIDYSPLPSFPMLRKIEQDEIKPGDLVAISATNLQKIYVGRGPEGSPAASFGAFVDLLRAQPPLAQLGYTIFVYRMPREL